MEFEHFFLRLTEKSWVTKQVKIVLSDRNSVSNEEKVLNDYYKNLRVNLQYQKCLELITGAQFFE